MGRVSFKPTKRKPAARRGKTVAPPRRGKTTAPPRPTNTYALHRERAGQRQREAALVGKEIGAIPAVADQKRRESSARNFRLFCETYFARAFRLGWSRDHLRAIVLITLVVLTGGLFAFAMPRGGGKTTLVRVAVIWALLYGHRFWACLIGATDDAALKLLRSIKRDLLNNPLLLADFPEVIYPIVALEGEPRRCLGQTCNGKKTNIVWKEDELVLPTIPGSDASGSKITVCGITGNIRGQVDNRADGTVHRPDLVIPDDPQTKESAGSPKQNKDRIEILNGDILGLAGPDVAISGLMPCTVIKSGDMADTILDRKKSPDWRGERTKMVNAFPSNETLWDEYRRLREESLARDGNGEEATAFYRAHKKAMDAGADVAWPERFPPMFASALEFAMVLRFRDPHVFAAEFQNEPLSDVEGLFDFLTADQIADKLSGHKRAVVPAGAHQLTAFIDVQHKLLYWIVCAWEDDFTGYVIAYGTWPDQNLGYFTLRDAKRTIFTAKPGAGLEGAIYHALGELTKELLNREWLKDDGSALKISRCPVDAGDGAVTEVVDKFCRESAFAGVLLPSKGIGIGAGALPMNERPKKKGERSGLNWYIPTLKSGRRMRLLLFDANFWKTFVQSRLAVAIGDPTSLSLFGERDKNGRSKADHRLLADHLTAGYPVETKGRGRTVIEWKERPERTDNHWGDCLVGAAVAASMLGIQMREQRAPQPAKQKTFERVSYL